MIQNLGALSVYEAEYPGGVIDFNSKQFRKRTNFKGDDIYTMQVPKQFLPGFCFKRKVDGYTFDINNSAIIGIYDLDLNLVKQIHNTHVEIYSDGTYEWYKFMQKHTVDVGNNSGNTYLDNSTYKIYKPTELDCGLYYYIITLSKGNFADKVYYSEVFQVVDAEAVFQTGTQFEPGNNLVRNGDFAIGFSQWTKSGTWAITGGAAQYSGGGSNAILQQATAPAGLCRVKFTISNITCPIANSGIEVRAFEDTVNAKVSGLRVRTNGTHTFYAEHVNIFAIHVTGGATFTVDDISIEEILGFENKIYISAFNGCRGVNALPTGSDISQTPYTDFTLLDAEVLQPEYGEDIKQDENGQLEKIDSFVRAFKVRDISPLLLPEFMIDFLSKLNTFDFVSLHDGKLNLAYELTTSDDETDSISINNFKLKNQWQGSDVYGLVNLSFDENIGIKNTCCDDFGLCDCDIHAAVSFQIDPEYEITDCNKIVHLIPGISVEIATCLLLELYVAVKSASDVDCESDPLSYGSTGIVITGADFAANGLYYYIDDTSQSYCLKFKVTQHNCALVDSYSNTEKVIPADFEAC